MNLSFTTVVHNEGGMHARPCGALVQYVVSNNLDVTLRYAEREVNADSVLDILSLCIPKGAEISITIKGNQERDINNGTISIEHIAQEIRALF
jgi:phosphocarrier protein HPr